jgi:putative glycosyltransferase
MELSVVATLYRSAPFLREFHRRACAAAEKVTGDFEIVLVNDGSPDDAQAVALTLCREDPRVQVVELSRNFGHHKAMMTGLAHARGRLVFLIDSDLEEDPELLESFHRELLASGADVVYGVQRRRKGGWYERLTGSLFYRLFNALSPVPIPPNLTTARLMTRPYVRALLRHRDRELFIAGLWAITGFRQVPLAVQKHSRPGSSYTFARKLALLVNAVTSFSNRPLVLIFYLGCVLLSASGAAGLYLIARRLFCGELTEGWASIMVSIWFLCGLILFCLGIMAIYLSKIFMETKRRPLTVVRHVHGQRPGRKTGNEARRPLAAD